jgi:hypothetical protein
MTLHSGLSNTKVFDGTARMSAMTGSLARPMPNPIANSSMLTLRLRGNERKATAVARRLAHPGVRVGQGPKARRTRERIRGRAVT